MKKLLLLLIITSLTSCKQNNRQESENGEDAASTFVKSIEAMHNKSSWDDKDAVAFDIELSFNGEQRLDARITSLTNSSQVRVEKKDGTILFYNGEQMFLHPNDAEANSARFDVFAWQYFFALPYKVSDPGTKLEVLEQKRMMGNILKRARLTFDENTGDSPDDWYLLYQESDTGLLHAAAYIVTLGKNIEEAEKNPHAIIYRDYVVESGIPVSTRWTFHNWSEEDGFGEQIGEAVISNISFPNADDALFEEPANSRVLKK